MNLRSIISTFLLSSPSPCGPVALLCLCCVVRAFRVRCAFNRSVRFYDFDWHTIYDIQMELLLHTYIFDTYAQATVPSNAKMPATTKSLQVLSRLGKYLLVAAIRVDLSQSSRFVLRFCDTIRMSSAKIRPQCLNIKQVADTKQGYRRRKKANQQFRDWINIFLDFFIFYLFSRRQSGPTHTILAIVEQRMTIGATISLTKRKFVTCLWTVIGYRDGSRLDGVCVLAKLLAIVKLIKQENSRW